MSCADLDSDRQHCGKCNENCGEEASCVSGKCEERDDDDEDDDEKDKDKPGKGND